MFIKLQDILNVEFNKQKLENIWAHIDEGKQSETLLEHTKCTEKYFLRLLNERKLDNIIQNFIDVFFYEASIEVKNIFRILLDNIITFHDIGKINPYFQCNKLKNNRYYKKDCALFKDGKHSILSAAIYIDYFIKYINDYSDINSEKKYKKILKYFVIVNAYIISRHHSDYCDFFEFCNDLQENGKIIDVLEELKNGVLEEFYKVRTEKYKGLKNILKNANENVYNLQNDSSEYSIMVYLYTKFMYSVLVSCDYYATAEYMNGLEIKDYGNIDEINAFSKIYNNTDLVKSIRNFDKSSKDDKKDINYLRKLMFLEAEENLLKNLDKNIFYLEAPTGAGKSNMALNTSLKLLNEKINKIIYVYPFNTLVDQNFKSLKNVFENEEIMKKIAVINSITPIKKDDMKVDEDYSEKDYQKFLLDRQFLNYPFILTTHVSVFETIFSTKRCSAISFYQLCGSVIVLDEIQSYKNKIWTEIMYFLQAMSKVLNIKVVIMSATLPNLEYLTGKTEGIVNLITNRNRYFEDERFKSRVKISYELLNKQIDDNELIEHILKNASKDRNIVIEFISKKRAYDIYDKIKEMVDNQIEVLCLTGDYNQFDRENTIEKISNSKGNILVATQVIEAGVDIDMDIGYKDISKLDSEEQFIGRINRNYDEDKKKYSIVYFFDMDKEKRIYKEDLRVENDLSIRNEKVQDILLTKDFNLYYKKVMDYIKKIYNDRLSGEGVNEFFNNLKKLEYSDIEKRMKLIEDDENLISIFLNIKDNKPSKDGEELCGEAVWEEYKKILSDNSIEYAEKQVRLSEIRSKMNYFIYQTRKRISKYDEVIGELYYIKEGDSYIKDGHFSMENNDFI